MIWIVVVALLVVPWLEMWVLFRLGTSLAANIVLAVLTAAAGVRFARSESLELWSELEADLRNERLPPVETVEAMLVVLAGWALIVPGYLTDLAGAAVLVPPVRRLLASPARALLVRLRPGG